VGAGYTASPAPMGIGDFGLGTSPYTYNSSHFEGSLTLNAANGTYPGAYYFITPPGATGGSYNSPYYLGIQLNTVTTNVSVPGNNQTAFWTQNVVTLNGNWVQFEDNVWNFSNTHGLLLPGSILSGNGNYVAPSYYYDYGPAVPLTFPVTIDLYNNVSVVNHMDQVTFGYRVVDSKGAFQGVYDTVVFNNIWAPLNPEYKPAFQVSGQYTTPLGLDYDAELIFGGPGGGSNAVLNNLSGTETLQYSNQASGGWTSVPSAYDFGTDTGETAIGVAETWTPGGTVGLSAGPSLLYGLWNSVPYTSVPSGSIEYQGTMSPSYGFAFIGDYTTLYSNVSYLPTNANGGFLTYLPPTGTNNPTYYAYFLADGYARPTIPYSFTAAATGVTIALALSPGTDTAPLYIDGNTQAQAAAVALTGWTSGPYIFSGLTLLNGTGGAYDAFFFDHLNDWGFVSWNLFQATGVTAPINVTGMTQGNSDYPAMGDNEYFLDGPPIHSASTLLGIAPALTNSLPGYGQLVAFYSDPQVQVYNQESPGYFGGSSLDPSGYYNLNPAGGGVVLWNTPDVSVNDAVATDGSYGVYVAGSPDATVSNVYSEIGANAVSVAGSTDATVTNVEAEYSVWTYNNEGWVNQTPFGVYDDGSLGGTFSDISAYYGAVGFADFFGTGAVVNDVFAVGPSPSVPDSNIDYFAIGTLLDGAFDTSINNTLVYPYAIGVVDGAYGYGSYGTTITNISAYGFGDTALTVVLYSSDYTTITNLYAADTYEGAFLEGAQNTTFTNAEFAVATYGVFGLGPNYVTFDNLTLWDNEGGIVGEGWGNTTFLGTTIVENYYGVDLEYVYNTAFTNTNMSDNDYGVYLEFPILTSFTNLNVSESDYGVYLADAVTTTLTNIVGYGSVAVYVDGGTSVTATGITAEDEIYDAAVYLYDGSGATVKDVSSSDYDAGVEFDEWTTATVSTVTATNTSVGVFITESSHISVSGVTVSTDALGVGIEDGSSYISVTGVSVTDDEFPDYSIGVDASDSSYVSVSQVTVSDQSLGVEMDDTYESSVTTLTVSGESIGVWVEDESEWTTVNTATVTNMSIAVFSEDSYETVVSGVTATNTTLSNPWPNSYPWDLGDYGGVAAVLTYDDYLDSVSNVVATTYPAAYYDYESYDPGVSNVNATSSEYAIVLDDTAYGVFNNVGAYKDFEGMYIFDDARYNVITGSSFVDCTSYGIGIYGGYENLIYENNFIGNNGATTTFNAAHIQAYSGDEEGYNYFSAQSIGDYVGNYWSDWHSYNANGTLAPYPIGDGNWDYYPLGGLEGTVAVTFYETGLVSGATWSVTFNGATQSTANTWMTFYALPGTYAFTAGSVVGYTVSPSSGNVTATGTAVTDSLAYSLIPPTPAVYTVTLTEKGLPAGATWSAIVGGVLGTSNTSKVTIEVGAGTFAYQIPAIAGYTASPSSGSITVSGAYDLSVQFTVVTYAVTVTESGLSSGQSWSATVNGNTQTSTGAAITFSLANGTYSFSVANVSGYTLSSGTGSLTVNGAPTGVSVSFAPTTSTSVVSTDTFNTWLAVLIAIAVIALVIGLLALFLRRRPEQQQGTAPAAGASATAPADSAGASASPASGDAGSTSWSEGPPAGGSPPS